MKFIYYSVFRKPIEIYKLFKRLSTEICLTLFLDVNFQTASELAEKVVSLTTTHWHGIISVPLNLKVPLLESKSTFGHALEAKVSTDWTCSSVVQLRINMWMVTGSNPVQSDMLSDIVRS